MNISLGVSIPLNLKEEIVQSFFAYLPKPIHPWMSKRVSTGPSKADNFSIKVWVDSIDSFGQEQKLGSITN